jgi:hypothetical protein
MTNSGGSLQTFDLEFETLREFRETMAPRFNYEGFFIEKTDPLPRGTRAKFRFVLPDGYVLAEGTGVVAWSRYEDEDPEKPAGMALFFDALDQQNREVVDELVEFHRSTGGEPFDLGPRANEAGEIGTDALSGDVFDVPPPPDSAVPRRSDPDLDSAGASVGASDNYLPEWLSEVAQNHDKEILDGDAGPGDDPLETGRPELVSELRDAIETPETADLDNGDEPGVVTRPAMPELDANLFRDEERSELQLEDEVSDDLELEEEVSEDLELEGEGADALEPEEEADGDVRLDDQASDVVLLEKEIPDIGEFEEDAGGTPFRNDVPASPEITLPREESSETPRGLRLRYILPVVAVLVAASAIVFWIVNRTIPLDDPAAETSGGPPVAEIAAAAEEEPAPELDALPTEQPADLAADDVEAAVTEADEIEVVTEESGQPIAATAATRLLLVTASNVGDGTVVTVRANGEMTENSVRVTLLKDPARVWVRIRGIETFYRPNEIEVGTPEVERLRIGHHPEETPQSIYVVADLANPEATIRERTMEGETLRVVIAR